MSQKSTMFFSAAKDTLPFMSFIFTEKSRIGHPFYICQKYLGLLCLYTQCEAICRDSSHNLSDKKFLEIIILDVLLAMGT